MSLTISLKLLGLEWDNVDMMAQEYTGVTESKAFHIRNYPSPSDQYSKCPAIWCHTNENIASQVE